MGHKIMENDKVVYWGEKPWHGIGEESNTLMTMEEVYLKCFNWDIQKEKLYTYDDLLIPDKWAVVRVNKDGHRIPLGAVGNVYTINQNIRWKEIIDAIVGAGLAVVETAGTLKNGRICWVALRVNADPINGKDEIVKYFSFFTGHDGMLRSIFTFCGIRTVCWNTMSFNLSSAYGDKTAQNFYAVKHTNSQEEKLAMAKDIFRDAFTYFDQLKNSMDILKQIKMNLDKQREFVTELIAPKKEVIPQGAIPWNDVASQFKSPELELVKVSTRTENTINRVMDLIENGKGTDIEGVKGTAYGLLQGITEYTDQVMSTRASGETETEKQRNRLENRFLSIMQGSGQDLKQRAFDKLIQL